MAMTKEQWEQVYNILDKIREDFLLAYPNYLNDKKKKIREDAERQLDNFIFKADFHITKNLEVYQLLTGGEGNSEYGRAIIYDEFKQLRYFPNDIGQLLYKIKEKIETLNV